MISDFFTVTHRKGDSEAFTFKATKNGEPYTIPNDEAYYFTVKKSFDSPALIQKTANSNGEAFITFSINKSDTLEMPFGEYVWDLRCKKGDVITTPITVKKFVLAEVVGYV